MVCITIAWSSKTSWSTSVSTGNSWSRTASRASRRSHCSPRSTASAIESRTRPGCPSCSLAAARKMHPSSLRATSCTEYSGFSDCCVGVRRFPRFPTGYRVSADGSIEFGVLVVPDDVATNHRQGLRVLDVVYLHSPSDPGCSFVVRGEELPQTIAAWTSSGYRVCRYRQT